jgi:hypothetical protein
MIYMSKDKNENHNYNFNLIGAEVNDCISEITGALESFKDLELVRSDIFDSGFKSNNITNMYCDIKIKKATFNKPNQAPSIMRMVMTFNKFQMRSASLNFRQKSPSIKTIQSLKTELRNILDSQ